MTVVDLAEQEPLVVHTRPVLEMDDEQFFQFCRLNKDLRLERTAQGDIIVMAPEGGTSGRGNFEMAEIFNEWARRDGTGEAFGPATGFKLPNGATRSPDVSWVRKERLDALSDAQWERFLPLCPDFVLELRSRTDSLRTLQRKMEEYRENGARLGWLLDPVGTQVFVYRAGEEVECVVDPDLLSGEPVLPGFALDVPRIWRVMQRRPR